MIFEFMGRVFYLELEDMGLGLDCVIISWEILRTLFYFFGFLFVRL